MITLYAPAKLNLYLDVLDRRNDGYHDIVTILQTININDIIQLEEANEITIKSSGFDVPEDNSNLACKAAYILQRYIGEKKGVKIYLQKYIPVGAGLGGGSSDAAYILMGLNKLWQANLDDDTLSQLGKELGADVPFFITGGTCLAKGIGTEIVKLAELRDVWFVVVYPSIRISTSWVYKNLKFKLTNRSKSVKIILTGIKNNDVTKIAEGLYNRLEEVTLEYYPEIRLIKDRLQNAGCIGTLMTGSGSCVFGIAKDKDEAYNIYEKLKRGGDEKNIFVAKCV
jgi:4-diphosphocytidyl-2-C-methyl-D-erythritol kinase